MCAGRANRKYSKVTCVPQLGLIFFVGSVNQAEALILMIWERFLGFSEKGQFLICSPLEPNAINALEAKF